jgi:hypothetical protein
MYKKINNHGEENTLEQIQEIRDLISEFQKNPNQDTFNKINYLTEKLTN